MSSGKDLEQSRKVKVLKAEQILANLPAEKQRIIMWHGNAITVRELLPITELSSFVNSVLNCCYDEKHDVVVPEMMDFAFRINVITSYATVELPDEICNQYAMAYQTDLFDSIVSVINKQQLCAIRDAIELCLKKSS